MTDVAINTQKPFTGLTWKPGLISAGGPVWGLGIICQDLREQVEESGTVGDIELWQKQNDLSGHKGLFVGDTTSLPAQGWVKLATF